MPRFLIILIVVIILIPVLLIGALTFLLSNPEYYRDQLASRFEQETGFALSIEGDMTWRFLPPVAISITDVAIRPSGADTSLASLEAAEVDLALIPLIFSGEVAIHALTFDGLVINAVVDEQGKGSWETGASEPAASPGSAAAEQGAATDLTLDIEEIRILDTLINYTDRQAQAEYRIEMARFITGAIRYGEPASVDLAIKVIDAAGDLSAELEADGRLTLFEGFERITFAELAGTFDESPIEGRASVDMSGPRTAVEFALTLDALPVDRYLAEGEAASAAAEAPAEDVEVLPLETLRAITLDGKLAVDRITYGDFEFTDMDLTVTNVADELTADATIAGYNGEVTLEFTGSSAGRGAGQTNLRATGLDLESLTDFEWITGSLNLESNTTFTGNRLSDVLGTLDGTTTFDIADGTLDVTPIKRLAGIVDAVRGRQSSVAQWPDTMPFENMTGQHRFVAGAAAGQQLGFTLEVLEGEGTGGFDYFGNRIEYDLALSLTENEGPFSVGPGLARVTWPLRCEGPLDASPVELCLPDRAAIQRVIAGAAEQELKRKGEEVLREKLSEGLNRLFNRKEE